MNNKLFGKPMIEHDFNCDMSKIKLLPFDAYDHTMENLSEEELERLKRDGEKADRLLTELKYKSYYINGVQVSNGIPPASNKNVVYILWFEKWNDSRFDSSNDEVDSIWTTVEGLSERIDHLGLKKNYGSFLITWHNLNEPVWVEE